MFHTEQDQTRDLQPVGCKKMSWRDKCSSLPILTNGRGSFWAGQRAEHRHHPHKGVLTAGLPPPYYQVQLSKKLQSEYIKIDASASSLTLYPDMIYQLNVLRQKKVGASSDFRCLHPWNNFELKSKITVSSPLCILPSFKSPVIYLGTLFLPFFPCFPIVPQAVAMQTPQCAFWSVKGILTRHSGWHVPVLFLNEGINYLVLAEHLVGYHVVLLYHFHSCWCLESWIKQKGSLHKVQL